MEKLDITVDVLGKKGDIHYTSGTLYTNSPKFFMKYYLCNEVEECGICLSGKAIAMVDQSNQSSEQTNARVDKKEDRLISFPTAKDSVDKYKRALKVIDVEAVDKVATAKEIWEWIKQDIMNVDKSNLVVFGLIWLFSDKSLGNSAWLALLCLLCNMNLYEVIRMVSAIFVKYDKKKSLEAEVLEMGFGELVSYPIKKDDLKLYMKVKDGNFRFK